MPLGFGVTSVHPADLLKLLEKQLKETGQCTGPDPNPAGAGLGDNAFLSLWPDRLHMENPRSKRFVAIRPARFPLWQSVVQGSGVNPLVGYRIDPTQELVTNTVGFNAVITIGCFTQINSDPEMRSSNVLSEDVLSVTDFVLKVMAAVELWVPCDRIGNKLLREPGRILDGGFGYQPVNVKDGWWVPVSFDLEAKFSAKFTR